MTNQPQQVTRRLVPLEVRFYGGGTIRVVDGASEGGMPDPRLQGEIAFEVLREVQDVGGLYNHVLGEDTVAGAFQVKLSGTSKGFRELASYLLSIAELDVGGDSDFHEHHEMLSADGRTRVQVIVRRR